MRRRPSLTVLVPALIFWSLLGPVNPAGASTRAKATTKTAGAGATASATTAPARSVPGARPTITPGTPPWPGAPFIPTATSPSPTAGRPVPPTGLAPSVIGGTPVVENQFPFLAFLLVRNTSGTGYFEYCGGSLIAEQWVLTAAHCFIGQAPKMPDAVLIGRMVVSDTNGDFNAPDQVFVDPQFNPNSLEHDAALIHLALPSPQAEARVVDESQDSLTAPGTQASVIGLGSTSPTDKTAQPSTVQIAPQTILSDSDCATETGPGPQFLSATMLCAGQPNVGPCFGDSGGPLFVTTATGPAQIGIVSFGSNVCASTPSVYTRVSAERTWIRQTIASLPGPVNRLAGPDRDSTAVAISASSYPGANSASAVVLANRNSFADAIPGAPLAVAKNAPLLLTDADALDPVTAAEIQRVLTPGRTVYLLGGPVALTSTIDDSLVAMGYNVVRYGGANRFATAVAIADTGLGNPTTVLEATGLDFPDALAGGAAAATAHAAVLLTNGSTQAQDTATYLAAHPDDRRTALGGAAASADPTAAALSGPDRYATSVLVAQEFFPHPTTFAAADGVAFPDALAGGVNIGGRAGPLLLVPPAGPLPPSEVAWFTTSATSLSTGTVYGGPVAVSPSVLGELVSLIS